MTAPLCSPLPTAEEFVSSNLIFDNQVILKYPVNLIFIFAM
jgi:hypothetical protein